MAGVAEFAIHFGEFGGEDGGGGILLGEVLFAFSVVQDCHGNVTGGAIEGEDKAGDFACFEFRFYGTDEPVVEIGAGGLEFGEV